MNNEITSYPTVEHSHIEATPSGINVSRQNAHGVCEHVEVIRFSNAINRLDDGRFDKDLTDGMRVIGTIWEAERLGYFQPTDMQRVICWRWVVAGLFIIEQTDKNGTRSVPNENGEMDKAALYCGNYGCITVFPATERLSLAAHIEGLAVEKYGTGMGLKMAIRFYMDMTDASGGPLCLSNMGREGLTMLHDSFIRHLQTEGVPETPVMH